MPIFIDPEGLAPPQLMFLTVVYGYVLFQSSGLISGGSELLLLVPSVAGLVGSIVLPILGAVPDGMMVLFSGLGPDAQSEVSVGVGALAGSTVMLLTFPWVIAVVAGRVGLDEKGCASYPFKASEPMTFFKSGVGYGPEIPKGAKIMLATTLCFLVIQVPATIEEMKTSSTPKQADAENFPALIGLILCLVAFFGYLLLCYKDATEDKELAKIISEIKKGTVSIRIAVTKVAGTGSDKDSSLLDKNYKRLKMILKPFFKSYDTDNSGSVSPSELYSLLKDLGTRMTWNEAQALFQKFDVGDKSYGSLNIDEFTKCVINYLQSDDYTSQSKPAEAAPAPKDEDDEEEAEEVPEDLANMSPQQQMRRVIFRSCWQMGLGTFLVLIFSDPMVDVLSEWGNVLGVSPFYISFIVAPFASNASELLAAYTYAVKKSQKSITTSFSTLVGASCMNNTFCLGIFLALIYFKSLAWQFTAETIAIVMVQWLIAFFVISRSTHTTSVGLMIFACYPLCLFSVWFLENIVGLD